MAVPPISRPAPAGGRHRRSTVLFGAGAALLGSALPFVCGTAVWPEVVTPAYFVSRGLLMYRDIFFPHTPLLSHLTAAVGTLFGFSAPVFRGIVAVSVAATAALVVSGVRWPSHRDAAALGLALGAPLVLCWTVFADGPALWPDTWMAPLVLGAGLALERFERRGSRRALVGAGLLLGGAIMVKQTSAWIALAALLWTMAASRRRNAANAACLTAAVGTPYLLFVAGWYLAFGTWSHLRWTLLVPLQMGRAGDNLWLVNLDQLGEMAGLILALPAFVLARLSLPAPRRLRSPLLWMALGCAGMTFPRGGLIHVAAAVGLVALLQVRAVLVLWKFAVRGRRRSPRPGRLAVALAAAACTVSSVGVGVLGGGDLLLFGIGGPTYFWDDAATRLSLARARPHLEPGQEVLFYNVPYENLYPLTDTRFPGGVYVNPFFWDCLNKEGADARVVAELAARPGLPVFYREPDLDQTELRTTLLYRFLRDHTESVEWFDPRTSWRVVGPTTVRNSPLP